LFTENFKIFNLTYYGINIVDKTHEVRDNF
jgi:hypothetical protein